MSLPAPLRDTVEQHIGRPIATCRVLPGGDISRTWQLGFADGRHWVLKYNAHAPPNLFAAEAAGLRKIAGSQTLSTPAVIAEWSNALLLDYIATGTRSAAFWQQLGHDLARMHEHSAGHFGFDMDNYCGLTPQPNPAKVDGFAFFAEQRLLYQARLARTRNLLDSASLKRCENLALRLPELVPEQPPSLIHGDLWSGNLLCDRGGKPVLIDPACHYGWAEAELAMTALFGGFDQSFYRAYEEVRPLTPGWRQRLPLYNLYHLLNHLNLFGSGYHGQVLDVLNRFG